MMHCIVNSKLTLEVMHYSTPIQESDALQKITRKGLTAETWSDLRHFPEVTHFIVPEQESDALRTVSGSDSL